MNDEIEGFRRQINRRVGALYESGQRWLDAQDEVKRRTALAREKRWTERQVYALADAERDAR